MTGDLDVLEDWVGGLIARLAPAERRKLARAVGVDLRRSQAERIAAQKNPDGTAFAPRKRPAKAKAAIRSKAGRIKRRAAERQAGPMFRKLRRAGYLKVKASADDVQVGFPAGATSRIARVHQEGLRDRVVRAPGAKVVTYPARVLLGFTDADRQVLLDRVLAHLDL